jgi:hypothetical protein
VANGARTVPVVARHPSGVRRISQQGCISMTREAPNF